MVNHHYLLSGDRLSGWVEVFSAPSGSPRAGASGLIAHLRSLFATFGVPCRLSSDGGPEFTATATDEFLKRWVFTIVCRLPTIPNLTGEQRWQSRKLNAS